MIYNIKLNKSYNNIIKICNNNLNLRNYSNKIPSPSDQIIYDIKHNKINKNKNNNKDNNSIINGRIENDFVVKSNFTTEDRVKLLSIYKKNKRITKNQKSIIRETNQEKELIVNSEFNLNDPVFKDSFENFKNFQEGKRDINKSNNSNNISTTTTTTTTITTTTTTTITSTTTDELLENYKNNRFNFINNIKPLKYDIAIFSAVDSSFSNIGIIDDIKDGEHYSLLLKNIVEPVYVTERQLLMVLPTSHLRESANQITDQLIDSLLELAKFYDAPITELNNIKIKLFKENFNYLLKSINSFNNPAKREYIGEQVVSHFTNLNKNPYNALLDLLDIFTRLFIHKNQHFQLLSKELYREFFDRTKANSTDKNGNLWTDQQNRFEAVEIKDAIKYCFTTPINSKGESKSFSSLFWSDAIHSFLTFKLIQYFDCFEMDRETFYCYTKEYLKEYNQEIKYLLDPANQLDKKIFLKYCLTILKGINDGSWKPNLLLLHDEKIPNYNPKFENPKLIRSFKIFKKLLKRCLVSFNEKENTLIIIKEMCSHVKIDNINQLKYLVVGLNEIESHDTMIEIKEKVIGDKFMDLPLDKVKRMVNQDNSNSNSSKLLNFENKRKILDQRSFTIDSITTKDVDDAIGIVKEDNGEYSILVHISDVTDNVKPFSDLFDWAKYQSSSIYLPNYTHFMLPKYISDQSSLEPNKENKCLTYQFRINENGQIIDYKIYPSIVKNIIKTNYEKVTNSINHYNNNSNNSNNSIHSNDEILELNQLLNIALLLKKNRELKGVSMINLPKSKVEFNNETKKYEFVEEDNGSISNILVSELMIATNWISSDYSIKNNIPIPFRVQSEPDFNANLEHLSTLHPIAGSHLLLKQFKKGILDFNNIGHYSLGLDSYTWSTSPIRRFSDMLVHSQIKNHLLENQPLFNTQYLETTLPYVQKNLESIKSFQKKCQKEILNRMLRVQGINKLYRAVKLSMVTFENKTFIKFLLLDHGLLSVMVVVNNNSNLGQLDNKIYLLESKIDHKNNFKFEIVNQE